MAHTGVPVQFAAARVEAASKPNESPFRAFFLDSQAMSGAWGTVSSLGRLAAVEIS
jgi:hypothetical protein